MRRFLPLAGLLALFGCTPDPEPVPEYEGECGYPEGAVQPMAVGEVLWPYAWPEAIAADGTNAPLDLHDAPCATDEVIDWSPFDVLLFVSIPAW